MKATVFLAHEEVCGLIITVRIFSINAVLSCKIYALGTFKSGQILTLSFSNNENNFEENAMTSLNICNYYLRFLNH